MPVDDKHLDRHDQRLSRLEAIVEGLTTDVNRIAQAVEALADRVSSNNQTPWAALASWAAVVLAVVGLAGSGYVRDMDRIEHTLKEVTSAHATHIVEPGHPPMTQRVVNVEESVVNLDTVLQREMRLLDQRADQRLDGEIARLDEVLQREVRFLLDSLNVRISAIEEREREKRLNGNH